MTNHAVQIRLNVVMSYHHRQRIGHPTGKGNGTYPECADPPNMDNQTQTKPKQTATMKALFMFDTHRQINVEMLATFDIGNIPTLTFGYTNGDDIEPAQIHRMVASIGRQLANTQQPTTDENGDELERHDDECECCQCGEHDWVSLDKGETIECRYCDDEITLDELDAIYGDNY